MDTTVILACFSILSIFILDITKTNLLFLLLLSSMCMAFYNESEVIFLSQGANNFKSTLEGQ